jgi:hypothetical protein
MSEKLDRATKALGLIARNGTDWTRHNIVGVAKDALRDIGLNIDVKEVCECAACRKDVVLAEGHWQRLDEDLLHIAETHGVPHGSLVCDDCLFSILD